MGRAAEYAFNRDGDWLAYTMSSPDQVGNGVQLRNMKTGVSRSLENARLLYTHLAWVDSSAALSVMRGRLDSLTRDTVFSIEAFTNFGADGPTRRIVFDPVGREDFPGGMEGRVGSVAAIRRGRYRNLLRRARGPADSADRRCARGGAPARWLALRVPAAPAPWRPGGRAGGAPAGSSTDSIPSLILWHYKDPRLQSQQIVQEQQDRAFSYLAEYRVGDDRFVRLADDSIRTVTVTNGDTLRVRRQSIAVRGAGQLHRPQLSGCVLDRSQDWCAQADPEEEADRRDVRLTRRQAGPVLGEGCQLVGAGPRDR